MVHTVAESEFFPKIDFQKMFQFSMKIVWKHQLGLGEPGNSYTGVKKMVLVSFLTVQRQRPLLTKNESKNY